MENKKVEVWMYQVGGENFALLLGIIATVVISYVFYTINVWVFISLLVIGLAYLKLRQAQQLGGAIRVYEGQFPEIFSTFKKLATTLNIPKANLYITQDPYLNAFTIGIDTCTVILNSALVEQLSSKELSYVIGHELGHFKTKHTVITSFINPLGNGNVFSDFIFGFWQRKAEYSCDRCGLLLTKDIDSAVSALLKLSLGGNLFKNFAVEGYLPQLKSSDTASVKMSELLISHPTTANRIRNILNYWNENFTTRTR